MGSDPVFLTAEIRRIEQAAGEGSPSLMERAGAAAADLAARLVAENAKDILVLAGPGNNGGDARIAAARLQEKFFRVALASHPRELPPERTWGLVIDGLFGIGLALYFAARFPIDTAFSAALKSSEFAPRLIQAGETLVPLLPHAVRALQSVI